MNKQEIDALGLPDEVTKQMYAENGITEINTEETLKDSLNEPVNNGDNFNINDGNEDELIGHIKRPTDGDNRNTDEGSGFNEKTFDNIETESNLSKEECFELGTMLVGFFDIGMSTAARYYSGGELTNDEASPPKKRLDMLSNIVGKIIFKYQTRFPLFGLLIAGVFFVYAPIFYEADKARKMKKRRKTTDAPYEDVTPKTKASTIKKTEADKKPNGRPGRNRIREVKDIV